MKITDCHTHFFPPEIADCPEKWAEKNGEIYWGKLVGKRPDGKKSLQGFPDADKFLHDMDSAGVGRAVIQGWYWVNPETCDSENARIIKFAAAHPDRISAFASINPAKFPAPERQISKLRDAGFSGIGELHDGVQKFDFLSEEFSEIARACAEADFPICVHLTEKSERQYFGKVATNFDAAYEAARRNPDTKFIFAHFSGGDALDGFPLPPNVYFDTAAFPLTNDSAALARATQKYPDRALYGSDYPIRLYPRKFREEEMDTIVGEAKSVVSAEVAQRFFSQNFESLYAR